MEQNNLTKKHFVWGIMSNFGERLDELIGEQELNQKMFAEKVGINAGSISFYLRNIHIPTVEHLIKIANYFNCSTDFLLGREEESRNITFKQCPPFSERIAYLKERSGGSAQSFYQGLGISKTCYYGWLNGTRKPTLDNIIYIADKLDCRVDFILGRES